MSERLTLKNNKCLDLPFRDRILGVLMLLNQVNNIERGLSIKRLATMDTLAQDPEIPEALKQEFISTYCNDPVYHLERWIAAANDIPQFPGEFRHELLPEDQIYFLPYEDEGDRQPDPDIDIDARML